MLRFLSVNFLMPMTLAMAALLSGCDRYALDRKMEELCRKDGGVRVYETVTLPPSEYEAVFKYSTKIKNKEEYYGPEYRHVLERKILVGEHANAEKGEGSLSRWYEAIYRRVDNRLLGEFVSYGRTGGDGFTFGLHPSSKSCPHVERGLATSVFIKGN